MIVCQKLKYYGESMQTHWDFSLMEHLMHMC